LLVIAQPDASDYLRVPILLTGDFDRAARLLQLLGTTLNVPFLFGGDTAGWKAEAARAKHRSPIRASVSV
jgi:hypothetical protein